MRAGRANLRAGRANLRPTGGGDGRKDGRTYGNSPLCSTGHRPFGAAAQKRAIGSGRKSSSQRLQMSPQNLVARVAGAIGLDP